MRIKMNHVIVLVYLAILVVGLAYTSDLRWAAGAMPSYLQGSIRLPQERRLQMAARKLIDGNDWEQRRAQEMLELSLAIDPNGEAGFWLAELLRSANRWDEAIRQFEDYLEIDPTRPEAFLMLSALYEWSGDRDEAIRVLETGRDYFGGSADQYVPRIDNDVPSSFNEKARRTYEIYRLSGGMLQREIDALETRMADPEKRNGAGSAPAPSR